jgi:hypothetical protein
MTKEPRAGDRLRGGGPRRGSLAGDEASVGAQAMGRVYSRRPESCGSAGNGRRPIDATAWCWRSAPIISRQGARHRPRARRDAP